MFLKPCLVEQTPLREAEGPSRLEVGDLVVRIKRDTQKESLTLCYLTTAGVEPAIS